MRSLRHSSSSHRQASTVSIHVDGCQPLRIAGETEIIGACDDSSRELPGSRSWRHQSRTPIQSVAASSASCSSLVGLLGFVPGVTTHVGDLSFAGHDERGEAARHVPGVDPAQPLPPALRRRRPRPGEDRPMARAPILTGGGSSTWRSGCSARRGGRLAAREHRGQLAAFPGSGSGCSGSASLPARSARSSAAVTWAC